MATFANCSKDLFSIVVNVDPVDIHPGSHDVADSAIANIENPLHHLLLRLLQEPTFLTGSDQKFQLFRGVQGFLDGSCAQAAEPEHKVAQAVEGDDRRPEQEQEHAERSYDPKRRSLAALERQAFRCELTKDDMKRGDDNERDRNGDGVGADGRKRSEPYLIEKARSAVRAQAHRSNRVPARKS